MERIVRKEKKEKKEKINYNIIDAGNPPDFAIGYLTYRFGAHLVPSFGYLIFDDYLKKRLLVKVPGYNSNTISSPTTSTSHKNMRKRERERNKKRKK